MAASALFTAGGLLVLLWPWHPWLWFRAVFASLLLFEGWNQLLCMRQERRRRAAARARRLAAQAERRQLKEAEAHASLDAWDLWSVVLVMRARYEGEESNAEDEHGGGEPVS